MPELPVKRVVLYKHGVGYFEREGSVSGDTAVSLTFKQREVSDVLKSLTVLDLDGGVISAVSYDSTTPVEQLLAEIALSIPDSGSLVGLLPQLKGARISVKPTASTAPVLGALLGIDTVTTNTESGVVEQVRLSVLSDSAEVRTFDLFDVDVQLLDEGLKRDLDFYLKTQLGSKKKDARTFTLFATGEGERRLAVGYVLEAPVWKATYRILLKDSESKEQPMIQGWAVVDNTSDEDWTDVDLTLVAGLPVSFVHDLYTPRYIRRPVIEVKESTGVLPPMAEAAMMVFEADEELESVDSYLMAAPATGMALASAPAKAKMRARGEAKYSASEPLRRSAPSSVAMQTRERQVGDLFEYSIDKPVTVRRNQSALVPIVLKPFAGRSVLLYQKHARAENPIRCVDFENTTGLTLEGGPVTMIEDGSYVGEAMLDTMKPTEKRLVGYAVELSVRVTDSIDSRKERVSRVVISKGTLYTYNAQVQKTTYTFASKATKEQILFVDHPRPAGDWELTEPKEPHETTENYWRFRLVLPPNTTAQFAVKMKCPQSQSVGLYDISDNTLAAWVKSKYIDEKTEKVLRESFNIRQQIADFSQQIAQLSNERDKIHKEQQRIRENLQALGDRASEKELRERYIRTLGQQEDRIVEIEKESAAALKKRDAANALLNEKLQSLQFETDV